LRKPRRKTSPAALRERGERRRDNGKRTKNPGVHQKISDFPARERRARYDAAGCAAENQKAAEKAAHEAAKQEMRDGKYPIQLQWYDGEILSGYMPADEAVRELLEELGLGKYVEGWGTYIDAHTVETLGGPEFFYAVAKAIHDGRQAGIVEKKAQQEAERQGKFDEAKATGKPVLLYQWTEPCCDPREECSTDVHREYAMPDGSTRHDWHHSF